MNIENSLLECNMIHNFSDNDDSFLSFVNIYFDLNWREE